MKIYPFSEKIWVFQSEKNYSNVVLIKDDDTFILVDTFIFPKDNENLKNKLLKVTDKIKWIFITHFHSDHYYGLDKFKEAHTKLIVQQNYHKTITAEKEFKQSKVIYNRKNEIKPDMIFHQEYKLTPDITLYYTPGHSLDSSILFLEPEKIIIAGDTILGSLNNKYLIPAFYLGQMNSLRQSLEHILHLNPNKIIPGHGEIVDKKKVEFDLSYLETLKKILHSNRKQNK